MSDFIIGKNAPPSAETVPLEHFLNAKLTSTIGFDTETTSLIEYRAKVIMFQVATTKGDRWGIDFRNLSTEDKLKVIDKVNTTQLIIGANTKYDYNVVKNFGGFIKPDMMDVLDMDRLLEMGIWDNKLDLIPFEKRTKVKRFSLAGLMRVHFNEVIDKTIRKNFTTIEDKEFSHDEWNYGLKDASDVLLLYNKLIYKSIKKGFTSIYDIDGEKYSDLLFSSTASTVLGDIEYNGIPISTEHWLKNIPFFQKKVNESRQALIKQLKKDKVRISYGLFGDHIDLNVNSPKQLLNFLKTSYNVVPTSGRGKHKKATTGRDALKKLNLPIVKPLQDYRTAVKRLSAFGTKFIKDFNDEGYVHTSFRRILHTFRISSSNPNVQQIPRDKSFRESFRVPNDTWVMITADYPQQEPHISGHKIKDKEVRHFYLKGHGDMHSYTASKVLSQMRGTEINIPPKVDGDEKALKLHFAHPDHGFRQKGKTLALRMDYGGGPAGLAELMDIPLKEAQAIQDAYFKAFPAKLRYFKKMQRFALANGFVYLNEISDIKRQFREFGKYKQLCNKSFLSSYEKRHKSQLEASIKRLAINTPTQGTAAMMTKAALIILRKHLIKHNIFPLKDAPIKLVLTVHDEVVVMAKKTHEKLAYDLLKYAMEKAALIFCEYIPMKVVPVALPYWDH